MVSDKSSHITSRSLKIGWTFGTILLDLIVKDISSSLPTSFSFPVHKLLSKG